MNRERALKVVRVLVGLLFSAMTHGFGNAGETDQVDL